MVKDEAQLYTMEGIAAGLIMLLTTYLVLGSTSVYTPGDTHITDMQLEQVGSDILRVMDTPMNLTGSLAPGRTDLELMVNRTDNASFYRNFTSTYLCRTTGPTPVAKEISVGCNDIQVNASIWYVGKSNLSESYLLPNLPNLNSSVYGPGVRVTHWIHTGWRPGGTALMNQQAANWNSMRTEPQEVLVEVLLWKV
jgi:hypothetical protein